MDKYMENSLLRAELKSALHQRDMLAQLLGECIAAGGITDPAIPLDGPQLLMFGEDLRDTLKGMRRD